MFTFWLHKNNLDDSLLSKYQLLLLWGWFILATINIVISIVWITKQQTKLIRTIVSITIIIASIMIDIGRWYSSNKFFHNMVPNINSWDYFGLALFVTCQCFIIAFDILSVF